MARLAALCLCLAVPGATHAASELRLILDVETPRPGAVLDPEDALLYVAGSAFEQEGERIRRVDVVFVIDVSGSTAEPAGADIDGDGVAGRSRKSKPAQPDSILGAETGAVAALLEQFNPHTTRVGIVAFSGGEGRRDAWVERALTRDYAKVRRALKDMLELGARGSTNMAAGLEAGARELIGTRLASRRTKVMVFLTDGKPTLPSLGPARNRELAIAAARKAAVRRIRIYSYAIGPEANENPEVMRAAARVSGGEFFAVEHPGELKTLLERVRLVDLDALEVRNTTTGSAVPAEARADGSFAALVGVQPGPNTIEVYGRTSEGTERTRRFEVTVAPGASNPRLTAGHNDERTRLVERRRLEAARAERELERTLEIEADD